MVSCLGLPVCVFIGRAGQMYSNATCSPDPSIDADRWRTSAQDRALRASPPPSGNPRPPTRPSDAHQPAPTASLQPGTRVDRNRHRDRSFPQVTQHASVMQEVGDETVSAKSTPPPAPPTPASSGPEMRPCTIGVKRGAPDFGGVVGPAGSRRPS